jgi:hypothetical protein
MTETTAAATAAAQSARRAEARHHHHPYTYEGFNGVVVQVPSGPTTVNTMHHRGGRDPQTGTSYDGQMYFGGETTDENGNMAYYDDAEGWRHYANGYTDQAYGWVEPGAAGVKARVAGRLDTDGGGTGEFAPIGNVPHYDGDTNTGERSLKVCRHFARGRCTWGNECRFSHDLTAALFDGPGSSVFCDPSESLPGVRPYRSAAGAESGAAKVARPVAVAPAPLNLHTEHQRYLGQQQQALQGQRHAVLEAALQAKFQIRAIHDPIPAANGAATAGAARATKPFHGGASPTDEGHQRGQVILTSLANSPDIIVSILAPEEVLRELETLSRHPRVADGGLHYLVGETTVFWSMVRLWHVNGTTGMLPWDALMEAALAGGPAAVPCMFHAMATGCLAKSCPFKHEGPSGSVVMTPP